MSYCRFGPKSDLYAYEGEYGYVLHVARSRFTEPEKIPDIDYGHGTKRFSRSYAKHMAALRVAQRAPIDLPFDGQSLIFETLSDMLWAILDLQDLGYRIEEAALNGIREEIKQEGPLGSRREAIVRSDGQHSGLNTPLSGGRDAGSISGPWAPISQGDWNAGVLGLPGDSASSDAPLPRSKCH